MIERVGKRMATILVIVTGYVATDHILPYASYGEALGEWYVVASFCIFSIVVLAVALFIVGEFPFSILIDMLNKKPKIDPSSMMGVMVLQLRLDSADTFVIVETDTERAIICLACGARSYNPEDVKQRYCARCKTFHADGKGLLLHP